MTFSQTLLLGAIAGMTILLGMPLARVKTVSKGLMSFLNAMSVGVLLFLLIEIVEHSIEPVEEALESSSADFTPLLLILVGGFVVGLMSLIYYSRRYSLMALGVAPKQLAMMIAIGIGLHNFSEGLAIGNSALQGELSLAWLLIIGFGLHNITEAFGIVAPVVGQRISWGFLFLLGVVGGGPTILGTMLGYSTSSEYLSVLFLALAGGAIVFVIGELLAVGRKFESSLWNGWGLVFGFFLAFGTELILKVAGA